MVVLRIHSLTGPPLTLTFRAGVTFHDGEPLDAEAVMFNIERYKTAPYSRRGSELKPVKAVTVMDPLTVRLDLSEPYAPLLAQLADRGIPFERRRAVFASTLQVRAEAERLLRLERPHGVWD